MVFIEIRMVKYNKHFCKPVPRFVFESAFQQRIRAASVTFSNTTANSSPSNNESRRSGSSLFTSTSSPLKHNPKSNNSNRNTVSLRQSQHQAPNTPASSISLIGQPDSPSNPMKQQSVTTISTNSRLFVNTAASAGKIKPQREKFSVPA